LRRQERYLFKKVDAKEARQLASKWEKEREAAEEARKKVEEKAKEKG
jgi:hypothetical protein